MRRLAAACLLCMALASCGKKGPGQGMASYDDPRGQFGCEVPAQWRVVENAGAVPSVQFLGPPNGPAPYSASIGIYRHRTTDPGYSPPERYARLMAAMAVSSEPPRRRPWRNSEATEFSVLRRPMALPDAPASSENRREDTLLVTVKGGYYALVYSAPESSFSKTEPVFRAVADSFALKD